MDDLLLELQVWSWDLWDGENLEVVKTSERRGLGMVECGSEPRTFSGWRVAPGWSGVAEVPGWTLGVVDFLGEALGS